MSGNITSSRELRLYDSEIMDVQFPPVRTHTPYELIYR